MAERSLDCADMTVITGMSWDRHKLWRFREGQGNWSQRRYIHTGRCLGIDTEVTYTYHAAAAPMLDRDLRSRQVVAAMSNAA